MSYPYLSDLPPQFNPPRKRRRWIWPSVAAGVVAVALVVGGLVYIDRPHDWYALGSSTELAAANHNDALVTGPVSELTKVCTTGMNDAPLRPAKADTASIQKWLQGCEATYHRLHSDQVIQDGVMYGKGAKSCTGSCETKAHAAGKSLALTASKVPALAPYDGSTRAAANWCTDLMDNHFGSQLPASAEAQLQANIPALGPATGFWDQSCEAGYDAALAPIQASDAVTVTGAFGTTANVTIPVQPPSSSLYVKTLAQGTGATLTSTEGAVGNFVVYDWSGTTNKLVSAAYSPASRSLFVGGQMIAGVQKALTGQKMGSRVLVVVPPADGLGSSAASEGIGANDTLVFVIDLYSTFGLDGVTGTQTSDGGGTLPTVIPPAPGSTSGPTITVPVNDTPPSTLQVKTLIKGTGMAIAKGDEIVANYNGYIWRTGKSFQSSWSTLDQPFSAVIGKGQVIQGWDTGLVGQTAGSRVLLVIPPADGYGSAGQSSAGIEGNDTLVFVIDILAVSSD